MNKKRFILLLALVVCMSFTLIGCGGGEASSDNESGTTEQTESAVVGKAADATEIKNGDVLKEDGVYECTVKGFDGGSEMSEPGDGITYSYSPQSGYAVWIELDLKNLGNEPLDSFDCDLIKNIELVYDDEYNYTGDVWIANDIPALASATAFVFFEAPEEVLNGEGSKVATFKIGKTDFVYNFQ